MGDRDQRTAEVPTRDVLVDVKKFLKDTSIFHDRQFNGSILFADLVGATEFKRDHSLQAGLAKVVQHNEVAREQITRFHGRVAKYIGDEVMGVFEGDGHERNALRAGIAIIEGMTAANTTQGWRTFPLSMSTRIGVHSGPISVFKYEEPIEDPQGTTVDIAARLRSMAGPDQVVCTDETYLAAGGKDEFTNASEPIKRFVRGIRDDVLALRVVVPTGRSCEPSLLEGHVTPLEKDFENARLLARTDPRQAIETLDRLTQRAPDHFHAHMCASELLLQEVDEPSTSCEERCILLDRAKQHLCLAKWARPQSCGVWLQLSWVQYKRFEVDKNPHLLEEAIGYAQRALERARDGLNLANELQAAVFLAQYLMARDARDSKKRQNDLSEAARLCKVVGGSISDPLAHYLAKYFATYAQVRVAVGEQSLDEVDKLIVRAEQEDPSLSQIHDARKDLARARQRTHDGPITGGLTG